MFGLKRGETWREAKYRRENEHLRAELAELRHELQAERSRVRILELEQEKLLEVIERDRRRVQAELSRHAAEIAEHEKGAK